MNGERREEGVAHPRVVLTALDKFRGTATAMQLSRGIERSQHRYDIRVDAQPMSDGGEGFIEAFRGDVTWVAVPGPLGEIVQARVLVGNVGAGALAIVEIADAVGRARLSEPSNADALAASSAGAGHLILAAQRLGADAILVGCGGTATSDGGLGCYEVLRDGGGFMVPVTAATDVTARFSGARNYATQKGVNPDELETIDLRLARIRDLYRDERGVDVETMERTGAAGGIPGALATFGARLTSGFEAVKDSVGLAQRIDAASFVVTGEGRFDQGSLEGKVTVGVAQLVDQRIPLLVVCGSVRQDAARQFLDRFPSATMASLEDRYGPESARANVVSLVERVVQEEIDRHLPR